LRVGIDASGLVSSKPATGLERYLSSLITHVAAQAKETGITLYLYLNRSLPTAARSGHLASILADSPIRWRIAPVQRGWYRLGMGIAMQLDRIQVFHFPTPHMARYCPVPSVVTIHDVASLSLEAELVQKESAYLPDMLDAARRATALVAVSNSAREEISRHLKRPEACLILEGVDLSQFHPVTDEETNKLRIIHGLERYVLCVGTLQTRKNHIRLIQAFEEIQDRVPHTLVIAGRGGSGSQAVHDYLVAHPGARVRSIGYVDDSLLPALYAGADLFALPSLWEGFGLPVLEAMACGTPVVASNVAALAEIAGDAAFLVEPRSTLEIAHALYMMLTDTSMRKHFVQLGLQRARMFSWDETARKTVNLYRQIVQR
jgi:glycosyltransferase involved in cell wall biosynthesis